MNFITVEEARQLIIKNIPSLTIQSIALVDSLGYYTAEDIIAPIDVPHFDNSAMDGYCFAFKDFEEAIPLKQRYNIRAGAMHLPVLQKGEAARIFTGAPMPKGADTVVIQEKIIVENDILKIESHEIARGLNVRLQASQTQKGDFIISKNTFISAGIIGYIAGFGIKTIKVFKKPKIGIIVTGKELRQLGTSLKPGQIYDSNSIALQAVLRQFNFDTEYIEVIDDNLSLLEDGIKKRLDTIDIILITGGISVGDYDFVQEALRRLCFEKIFYKVKQKPGKPLYFGKKGNKFIFGLPGNSAASFTCFYQYVYPFLKGFMGEKNVYTHTDRAILSHDFKKNTGLTHFVKGHVNKEKIMILSGQESYRMDAFIQANCLVMLEEATSFFAKGKEVEIIRLFN